jgi:hypothetical protein
MKFLKENLESHELSDAAIRNQFNKVKQELIDAGFKITSPKKGTYLAEAPKPKAKPSEKKTTDDSLVELLTSKSATVSYPSLMWGWTFDDKPTMIFE